ncbi:MAG TPA: HDOD domain-containing protein [Planctomycetota bacterium]|nr:HDOD domain-containing protein [Planctomycetota bacterium]
MATITTKPPRTLESTFDELAKLPPTLEKVLHFSLHEGSNARQLAEVCQSDTYLGSRILALVNSPMLGCRQPIGLVQHAAVILGINRIRNLTVASHVLESFSGALKSADADAFWRHSFAVADVARALGQASRSRHTENMYLAGLLHDAGILILERATPATYDPVLTRARLKKSSLEKDEAEAAVEVGHAEAGSRLARRWPVAASVAEAIRTHHAGLEGLPPDMEAGARDTAESVILAEMVCRHHGWGFVRAEAPFPEKFPQPSWLRLPRGEILEVFGLASLCSEETRRILRLLKRPGT